MWQTSPIGAQSRNKQVDSGSGSSCRPDPVCTTACSRVTSLLHTAHGDGVRALLSLSYPSTLCEVMVLAYPSVGEAVGGGEGMRRQTNKQRSHAAASDIHLKHAVTGVLYTHIGLL